MGRVLLCGGGLLILLAVVCVVAFSVWRHNLRKELNARVNAIQEKRLPVNWEDLESWPVVIPDEKNVALGLTNALAQLVEQGNPAEDLPRRGEPITPETRTAMTTWVRTNLAILETVHRVTNAESSRYPINHRDGPNALLPHLAKLKSTAGLLACEALLKAEEKDSSAATLSVESSLKLSQSLDNEPVLVSQLSSSAILAMTSKSLERVLCRTELSDEALLRLSRDFLRAEATNRLLVGLIGERALYNEFLRLAQDDVHQMITIANKGQSEEDQTALPARNPGVGWRLLGLFERDRNFFLRAMETNISVLSVMPPQSLALTNEWSKIQSDAGRGYYVLSSLLLPSLSSLVVRDADIRAHLRTAIAGMAIERWRLAHGGKIPGALHELVPTFMPAVPMDPFDGQPLRFKPSTNGYVVYSLGRNLEDDGGRDYPSRSGKVPKEQRSRIDITFTVERP